MGAGMKDTPVVESVRRSKSLNPVTLENIMNIKWYIGLILVLVAMSFPAKANELGPHLEGKKIVYVGTCFFDKDGTLTFSHDAKKLVVKCVVGMALPDQSKHFVLTYMNDKPAKLVVYDEKTKKQETLWVGNSI